MTAKIARGAAPRGKQKGKTTTARGKSAPVRQDAGETVRRLSMGLLVLVLVLVALAIAIAAMFKLPQMIGIEIGEAIGRSGFAVKRVEPKGLKRLAPMRVYQVADQQLGRAMPLVDLDETRAKLLELGWVQDARVSRRLPDTLVIDIVERTPAAIWQHNQQLMLIDQNGVTLEPVKLNAMPDLPLVIGPSANRHAGELNRLVGAAPELKPMMAGATWIGGRRWDLRFQSGEVLALPEGQEAAAKALVHFASMDRKSQLLGRGLVRFDMRIPDKLIVRVSNVPGTIVEAPPPAPVPNTPTVDTAQTI